MMDFRPVGYVIGLLIAALGAAMLVPMSLDLVIETIRQGAFLNRLFCQFWSAG